MENGRSEQAESSGNGPIVFASREHMKEEVFKMMFEILVQGKEPVSAEEEAAYSSSSSSSADNSDELKLLRKELHRLVYQNIPATDTAAYLVNCVRRIVREGIESFLEKLPNGSNLETKTLELRFLDKILSPVLTGTEIRNLEDKPIIGLALIDTKTGTIFNNGPESNLRAEIQIREANSNKPNPRGECSSSSSSYKGNKPHFSKAQSVDLHEGVGYLRNAKLGQDSKWTNNCECKLFARFVGDNNNNNLGGGESIRVQEAFSETFTVKDGRTKWRDKRNPPSLSDPLQKLKNIGAKGGPINHRLHEKNIKTVKDFRFWLSVDPQKLQEIFTGREGKATTNEAAAISTKWDATVQHAMTCVVDDAKLYLHFLPSSSGSETGVAFDAVGGIEGFVVDGSHFVPLHDLSRDQKDYGRILLKSAFENQKDVISYQNKSCLLKQFPQRSNNAQKGYLSSSSSDAAAVNSPENSEQHRRFQVWMAELGNMCKNRSSPVLENHRETDTCQLAAVSSSQQPSGGGARCSSFSVIVLATLWRKKLMELRSVRVHKRQRIY